MKIDHIVYGVRDIDAAAERFEREHGLASVPGGVHPGWGTVNRIVPLGQSYIELLGVVDEAAARANPLGSHLLQQVSDGDRPVGWCIAPGDLDAVAERLGLEPMPGARDLPDGTQVRWRGLGLVEAMSEPPLPFFIEWDVPPALHPGSGAATPRSIEWVELSGDAERLDEWLGGARLPVRFVDGPAGIRGVGVATATGVRELR